MSAVNVEKGKQGFQPGRLSAGLRASAPPPDVFATAVRRQHDLACRMRDLDCRYRLAIDLTIPEGVVRCVDCGRFAAESTGTHSCPVPAMIAAGVDPDAARALAAAGFDSAFEAHCWRRAIGTLGLERAGQWRTAGVGPFDAVRLDAAGADPASMYVADSDDPHGALAERVSACRATVTEWTRAATVPDARGCTFTGHPSEVMHEVVATGNAIADHIDDRIAVRHAELDTETREALLAFGLTVEQVDEAFARSGDGTLLCDTLRTMAVNGSSGIEPGMEMVWAVAHERCVWDLENRKRQAVVDETLAALGELRPLGGPLQATSTRTVAEVLGTVSERLPTDWLAASNSFRSPLRVESVRGGGRAFYSHSRRRTQRPTKTREFEVRTGTLSIPPHRHVEAQRDPVKVLRDYFPEAFVEQGSPEWQRAGQESSVRSGLRTRNITDASFDPVTGRVTYRAEHETMRFTYPQGHGDVVSLIRSSSTPTTMLHELGHRMENTVPGVRTLVRVWRDEREEAEGNRRVRLTSGRGEWGKAGGYVNDYVGRHYESGDTEVLSVGLESVLAGNYGNLRGDNGKPADRDHRALILGLLTTAGAPL